MTSSALETLQPDARVADASEAREVTHAKRFYHPELDGLRFFAFFAVFLYHSLPKEPGVYVKAHVPFEVARVVAGAMRAGMFGVPLFFVLSAYLITELLLREHATRGFLDVRAFYMRRALRIWPIYFLVVIVGFVLAQYIPGEVFRARDLVWFFVFGGNWLTAVDAVRASVIIPLWSVNVEEQFYLVWPWFMRTPSPRRVLTVAGALIAIAWIFRVGWMVVAPDNKAVVDATFTHLDAIAFGAVMVVVSRRRAQLGRGARAAVLVASVGTLVAFGAYVPWGATWMIFGYAAAAIASFGIVRATLVDGATPSLLKHPALVYLGRISYGLYVYHYIALDASKALWGRWDGLLATPRGLALFWTTSLAMTVAMAAVSYRVIELPFMRLKERFTYVPSRPTEARAEAP